LRERVNLGAGAMIDGLAGDAAFERKAWPEAVAHYRRAVRIDPEWGEAWWWLAIAASHLEDRETAAHAAWRAHELGREIAPEDRAWVVYLQADRATAEIRAGRPLLALEAARRAVTFAPGANPEWERVAWRELARSGAPAEAVTSASNDGLRAFTALPADVARTDWLVGTLALVTRDEIDAQRPASALEWARRAVAIAPDSPELWENLRLVAERAGEPTWVERARAELIRLPPRRR
jgi:tetratricopeptide (TPR) repeat protein